MRNRCPLGLVVAGASLVATAGCGSIPLGGGGYGAPRPMAATPVVPGYVLADVIGGQAARARKARAAGIRPLPAAEVAAYVGRQELELRRHTAGTGVEVIRSGDVILIRLPALLAFRVGSADLSPQAASIVSEIGFTLKSNNRSLVDVLGHTDSTGNGASNQRLSQQRAEAVAARLRARGVAAARLATRGYAAGHPIGDDSSEQGRALNRRVEIRVVPLR